MDDQVIMKSPKRKPYSLFLEVRHGGELKRASVDADQYDHLCERSLESLEDLLIEIRPHKEQP